MRRMPTTPLGAQIKRRREARGLSLRRLAAISGVPFTTIHGIEQGRQTSPALWILDGLSAALGVSVAALIKPRASAKKKRAA